MQLFEKCCEGGNERDFLDARIIDLIIEYKRQEIHSKTKRKEYINTPGYLLSLRRALVFYSFRLHFVSQ